MCAVARGGPGLDTQHVRSQPCLQPVIVLCLRASPIGSSLTGSPRISVLGIDSEKLFRCSLHCTACQTFCLTISARCSSEGCDPSGLRGYADLAYLLEAQCSTSAKDGLPGKTRDLKSDGPLSVIIPGSKPVPPVRHTGAAPASSQPMNLCGLPSQASLDTHAIELVMAGYSKF
jgi:hypothetical protein